MKLNCKGSRGSESNNWALRGAGVSNFITSEIEHHSVLNCWRNLNKRGFHFPKAPPSEKKLPNGERNTHVTIKPVALIKWLIKLLTPVDGMTIDITAGSCTHGVACEMLNKDEGYNLSWINIEIMNEAAEPYCAIGKARVEAI